MKSAASLKSNRYPILVLTVLLIFGLEIAKLGIWIRSYTENDGAKNAITGGTRMRECLNEDLISTL